METNELPGLTPNRIKALQAIGISKLNQLIYFFPRKYVDRSSLYRISDLTDSLIEPTLLVRVQSFQLLGHGRTKRLEALVKDDTGTMKLVWFKGVHYFEKSLSIGKQFLIWGAIKRFGTFWSMAHPNLEKIKDDSQIDHQLGVFPIYPSNQLFEKTYINSELIQKWVSELLKSYSTQEYLPDSVIESLELSSRSEALTYIHFPNYMNEYLKGLRRFRFEELFLFQLCVRKIRSERIERSRGVVFETSGALIHSFYSKILPFELTEGQKHAIAAIDKDFESGYQANRLIQGDVGSGKTIVAFISMLKAIQNGFQCAFMAPTEILAEQHFRNLSLFCEPLGISIRLLTGTQKSATKKEVLSDIENGTCSIAVGTHALFQQDVHFHKLGLAIIDEQHRFGVLQRNQLAEKGLHPHILVMSATPIPRSLAMTLYGDLDVTLIKGLPKNRKPIKTAVRTENQREVVYQFIDELLEDGGQVYIVFPLVEESEALDLKDATQGFEEIKNRFSKFTVGLVHGRLPSDKKDAVMQSFIKNETQILVSTTVIEVGVDVSNASFMIIEHAERFGLSQLHQLRGRVGRGDRQSYCVLMKGDILSKEGRIRLQTMEQTNDGFEVAEVDLKLRGPGDLLGTKQSGLPEFKFADIVRDQDILQTAKEIADSILEEDLHLELPKYQALKRVFTPYFEDRSKYYFTS